MTLINVATEVATAVQLGDLFARIGRLVALKAVGVDQLGTRLGYVHTGAPLDLVVAQRRQSRRESDVACRVDGNAAGKCRRTWCFLVDLADAKIGLDRVTPTDHAAQGAVVTDEDRLFAGAVDSAKRHQAVVVDRRAEELDRAQPLGAGARDLHDAARRIVAKDAARRQREWR